MGEVGEPICIDGQLASHLQQEVRDDSGQVGIAAALAQSVEGALDVVGALFDRRQGVGIGHASIVVGVDAELCVADLLPCGTHGLRDLRGQGAAVGVAEYERARASLPGGGEGLQGVLGIRLVAIEEVLSIVDDLTFFGDQVADGVPDDPEVFFGGGSQNLGNVKMPGLAEDRDHRRADREDRLQVGVIFRGAAGPAGAAEGGELRMAQIKVGGGLEEVDILGVGAGPASLDVVDGKLIQQPQDLQLVPP